MSKLKYCDCPHRLKHHKRSGRCRGDCGCKAAAIKTILKIRRDKAMRLVPGEDMRLHWKYEGMQHGSRRKDT